MDFSTVMSDVSSASIVTAMVGAAAIMVLPSFAKWGAKKLGSFFG